MNTQILLSGHARSFVDCLPNQWWMVFRHFPAPVFHLSFVDDDASGPAIEFAKRFFAGKATVHSETVNQPDQPQFPAIQSAHAPYANSVSHDAILGQLWHLDRVWQFAELQPTDDTQDIYIRCRPDIFFHVFDQPRVGEYRACFPWWGGFGGKNDRFAIFHNRRQADQYFTTYNRINQLVDAGCPLHPESLINASMEAMDTTDDLNAVFSTLRTDGILRWPEILTHEMRSQP